MSFDLYFYKKKISDLTEQTVANYLTTNLAFNHSDYSKQWLYENTETGVYFNIEWNEPNTEEEELELWDSFADFDTINFSFSINFFRPTYFALEIFPIIERMMDELDLFALNMQDEKDPDNPYKFEKGYLQDQWIRHNNRVSASGFTEYGLKFLELAKSNAMWWFQLHRTEIEASLVEDVFVAKYFIIKSNSDNQLYTACVWPEHIPIILPEVDYIIIRKKYKSFFKTVEESGLVAYGIVLDRIGNYLEDFECSVPNLKVLRQQNADRIKSKFNNLPIYMNVAEFGTGVGKDGFVNVKPD